MDTKNQNRIRSTRRRREERPDALGAVLSLQVLFLLLVSLWLLFGHFFLEDAPAKALRELLSSPDAFEEELETFRQTILQGEESLRQAFREVPKAQQPDTPGGQGGWNPFARDEAAESIPVPQDATLAAVVVNAPLLAPAEGTVTSLFGGRVHPITGEADFHMGLDIASPMGAPVLAALPGVVVETGENNIYGKYIVLEHSSNFTTRYCHCSEIVAQPGMNVRQGARIAKVGSTGVSTGPHLHFDLIVDGKHADPAQVLPLKLLPEES